MLVSEVCIVISSIKIKNDLALNALINEFIRMKLC